MPSRPRRSRARGRSDCLRPSAAWRNSSPSSRPPTRAYEHYRAHGRQKNGRLLGAPPKPYTPPAIPDGKINLTDLDSRLVHGMRGWVQGYNAQAVCNDQHLILAADVMTASPDFGHLGPMIAQARHELAAAGVSEDPAVVVADAGYWHLEQMNELTGDGIAVLIPPDSTRRKGQARPGWDGGAYSFMRSVLATDHGSVLYKQRAQLIEPIFGHTKHNRGFTRFHRRGRSAARTEWRLLATTHNLAEAAPPLQPDRLTAGRAAGIRRRREKTRRHGITRQPHAKAKPRANRLHRLVRG